MVILQKKFHRLVILLLLAVLVVSAFLLFVVRPARCERKRVRGRREAPAPEPVDDGLHRLLAPSVLCIATSMLCLCGASWAWFTATVSTAPLEIQTASYTVSVQQDDNAVTASADATYSLTMAAGGTYNITITPAGTASTGFCTVNFEGSTYYTPQLAPNSSAFSFTVYASQSGSLMITPQWGTCANTDTSNLIGTAIGTQTTQTTDAPQQADVPGSEAGIGADANPQAPVPQPSESSNAPAQSTPAGASDSAASGADAGTDSDAATDNNGNQSENPAASSDSSAPSDSSEAPNADADADQSQLQSAQSLDGVALPEN